ncbi:hypothetical protein TNCT1_69590 [Streptomyces sp. 1-11]|nr:hypothetical protein TNCT1_69590 [Streptomyces sp. 1-11]
MSMRPTAAPRQPVHTGDVTGRHRTPRPVPAPPAAPGRPRVCRRPPPVTECGQTGGGGGGGDNTLPGVISRGAKQPMRPPPCGSGTGAAS